MSRSYLFAASLLLAAVPLHAQLLAPDFQTYLQSPAFASRLSDMEAKAKDTSFKGCDTVKAGEARFVVVEPVTMRDGVPKDGMWKASVPMEGCGTTRVINAFFVVGKEGKIFFLLAAAGSTRGDARLQRDTVMYVVMAGAEATRDCKEKAKIIDTRFDTENPVPGSLTLGDRTVAFRKSWHETWTMEACGRVYDVGVDYLSDATGTTITASSANVVERVPVQ